MNHAGPGKAGQLLHLKSHTTQEDADRKSWAAQPLQRSGGPSGAKRDEFTVRWLGRRNFVEALRLQEELVGRKRDDHSLADTLLLLEHEPVYTIGRTPDRSSLLGAADLPYPLFAINRGGQATYHGPGQLMGYPIVDLGRCGQDLHKYLRWLEQLLIELLAEFEIAAVQRPGLTGVWVENAETTGPARKIASIGIGVRHWITMHGFALNVCGDLAPFANIVPCGISNVAMTSMELERGKPISVLDVATVFEKLALRRFSDLRLKESTQPAIA
jgi:lipoyl(octanoyl) transferase